MKMKITLFFLLALALPCAAAPFWSSPNPNFAVFTNVPVLVSTNYTTTNAVSALISTNSQETYKSIYHTLQIFNTATGTSTNSVTISKTIDGVNFIPYSTNTFMATGSAEYQLTGKWVAFRFVTSFKSTNSTIQVNYISQ